MKKALSLVLAVVFAFGMCTVAFAAKKNIDDIKIAGLYYMESPDTKQVPHEMGATQYDNGTQRADQEIKIWINPYNLLDDKGASYYASKGVVTTSQLSSQKITVRRNITKGSNVLDSLSFDQDKISQTIADEFYKASVSSTLPAGGAPTGRSAYISVDFVEYYVSTGSTDFEYKIYLYLDGKKIEDTEFFVSGTMKNEEIEIYEGEDYVSTEDGYVVKPEEYVRGIDMYLGDGVHAKLNMFKGTKYYGVARQEITAADDAVMAQYPEIETIYVLRAVNVNSSATKITFDISDTYYVYNADGEYIGTTAEDLPFSAKYYLATSRITMGGSTVVEEPGSEDGGTSSSTAPQNPNMGGDNT